MPADRDDMRELRAQDTEHARRIASLEARAQYLEAALKDTQAALQQVITRQAERDQRQELAIADLKTKAGGVAGGVSSVVAVVQLLINYILNGGSK